MASRIPCGADDAPKATPQADAARNVDVALETFPTDRKSALCIPDADIRSSHEFLLLSSALKDSFTTEQIVFEPASSCTGGGRLPDGVHANADSRRP